MILKLLKGASARVIQGILWCIDSDHRIKEEIAMDDMKKFTHVVDVDFQSDFGRATKAFRTVPYSVWQLKTKSFELIAADKHRVIRSDGTEAWLEDLVVGDLIRTENGDEPVTLIRDLNIRTHMYCIEVNTDDPNDPHNHLYYSNGILSHNTTCAAAYLLWRAMFVPNSTILVAANILTQAYEIMDRIRYAYENVPDQFRAGVTVYNRGSITFDNGSRILSRATTPTAGRGLSISLLYVDEFAFVNPSMAKDFWTAIAPVLSTGGDCIITSTPKSDVDQFATIYKEAADNRDSYGNPNPDGLGSNGFYAMRFPWHVHPERDEAWAEKFRKIIGPAKFKQEFECVSGDTRLHVMDPHGEEREMSIQSLYRLLSMCDFSPEN